MSNDLSLNENALDLIKIKEEASTLHGERIKWLERIEQYTYGYIRHMYTRIYQSIYDLRKLGVDDKSLDLEMTAVGLINELFSSERVYSLEDYKINSSLKVFDESLKKMALTTLSYDVKSVEDVVNYPVLEEVLRGFMENEVILNNKLVRIEMGR